MAGAPGLDQQHAIARVLAQARRQRGPGRTRADDDVVVVLHRILPLVLTACLATPWVQPPRRCQLACELCPSSPLPVNAKTAGKRLPVAAPALVPAAGLTRLASSHLRGECQKASKTRASAADRFAREAVAREPR